MKIAIYFESNGMPNGLEWNINRSSPNWIYQLLKHSEHVRVVWALLEAALCVYWLGAAKEIVESERSRRIEMIIVLRTNKIQQRSQRNFIHAVYTHLGWCQWYKDSQWTMASYNDKKKKFQYIPNKWWWQKIT